MHRLGVIALIALVAAAAAPAAAQTQPRATEVAQQTPRQRIIITPRRQQLGPNAKRDCEARLVEQYRPSGTVIVPVMNCWWR